MECALVLTVLVKGMSPDFSPHGSGPVSGSVAILKIDWATLKEIEK
jgi:hypothetical protein